jgi:ArsR family transcriptional regulator
MIPETLLLRDLASLARVQRALGDEVRLRILQLLPRTPVNCESLYNVNELSDELKIPQPTVSHHLKILRQAGLIRFTKKCNSVYYYLDVYHMKQSWRDLLAVVARKER